MDERDREIRNSHAWYSGRLEPDWRPRPLTLEQNQAILERLGLTGDFWRLD